VDLVKQQSALELFEQYRVSGAVIAPLDGPMVGVEAVRERGLPIVLVNWEGTPDRSCGVVVDEELGGYVAARHLLDQGARRLCFAGGPLALTAVRRRADGATRAVAEVPAAHLEFRESDRLTVRAGIELGKRILTGHPRVDGIVAAADALANGIVQTLLYAGIDVPADVLVIGYDNNHFAADTVVPISTVGQPGVEIGCLAAAPLMEEISDGGAHVHRSVVVKPELIVRRSSRGDISAARS
jgi:LacI family transcriptional regulator